MFMDIWEASLVEVVLSRDPLLGGLADDVAAEGRRLSAIGRAEEVAQFRTLWLTTFHFQMASWTDRRLLRSLGRAGAWSVDGQFRVYRTADLPAVAFTTVGSAGPVRLVLLGGCCEYPGGSEESWWIDVIRPRVRAL